MAGEKMITSFGWADSASTPMAVFDYYERLEPAMGDEPHDLKFFLR